MLDTAVHNLDLILWLMGRAPLTVLARARESDPDSDIAHSVTTLLMFAEGELATDQVAWVRDSAHPLHQCARSRLDLAGRQRCVPNRLE